MSCSTLALSDEVFGPAILSSNLTDEISTTQSEDMQWMGITLSAAAIPDFPVTPTRQATRYDISGEDILIGEPQPDQNGTQSISITINGKGFGNLPWRNPSPGSAHLQIARSGPGTDFIVVRDLESPMPGMVTYYIYQLNEPAGTPPIRLLPRRLGFQSNFCHNRNGQLALVWSGDQLVAPTQNYLASVYRIDVAVADQLIFEMEERKNIGIVGCEISTSRGRIMELFTGATTVGNSFSRPQNQGANNVFGSYPWPKANGQLSTSSLSFSGGVGQEQLFLIQNNGDDFLEVTSVSNLGNDLSVDPNNFPVCIAPGSSQEFKLKRLTRTKKTVTLTVNTAPQLSAGSLRVELKELPLIQGPTVPPLEPRQTFIQALIDFFRRILRRLGLIP